MASYHLSVKTIKRSAGRSATAAAAYRSGGIIACEREGRLHDYSRKIGVEACFILAPEGAPDWVQDRAALWNAAEARETRKNSVTAREWELALPAELGAEDRAALGREFGQALVARFGIAVDVALHAPHREGDQRNHHAHVLTTTRVIGTDGFGDKTRVLDAAKTGGAEIEAMRGLWAEMQNRALERAGEATRVDHRSLEVQRAAAEARGDALAAEELDRAPEVKLGPAVNAMERRAQREAAREGRSYEPVTERGRAVLALRQARAAWQQMRERVEQARAVYEQARDSGQGLISAGLAALRAAATSERGTEPAQGQETGRDPVSDLRARLAGILKRDRSGQDPERSTGTDAEITGRLSGILRRGTAAGDGQMPQPAQEAPRPRNPQLRRALAQIADRVARGERIGFGREEEARAFFRDLKQGYGAGILAQAATGDDRALAADFPEAGTRRQLARGIAELGRSYDEIARDGQEIGRSIGDRMSRGQDDGWEL